MALEPETLSYDFDEEAAGFAAPPRATPPRRTALHHAAAGLMALGALALVLFVGGLELGGGWSALGATFGLLVLGAALWFYVSFEDTPPGIKHDDTFFRGIQNRGVLGWALGLALTGFYVVLYFQADLAKLGFPPVLERPTRLCDPLSMLLSGKPAD
jgi:hypothetical protein